MDQYGGEKKSKKTKKTSNAKKTTKTTKTTKTSDAKKTKKSSTTRSKSKAKGGNFLGTVGDLVAPTGWGPFATAAGLLALDRADAALRRGTKEKKEKMKGGKKMTGGICQERQPGQIQHVTIGPPNLKGNRIGEIYSYYKNNKEYGKIRNEYEKWPNENQNIVIKCNDEGYYYEVNIMCDGDVKTYEHLPKKNSSVSRKQYYFTTFEEAMENAQKPEIQIALVKLALLHNCKKATNS